MDYCHSLNNLATKFNFNFKFSYHAVFECDLFHGEGESLNKVLSRDRDQYIQPFQTSMKYETMLDKILHTKEIGGFLTLEGGMDSIDTGCVNDNVFGYCVSKHFPDPKEIGAYSTSQIRGYGHDVPNYCKKSALTVPRLNFRAESPEVVSVQYFRWLVTVRKLQGYKIHHVAAYKELPNLSGFLDNLLQKRWDLKMKGEGGDLEGLTCKLMVNSFYGYSSIFLPKYPKTKIKSENSICQTGLGENVLNVTCMGYKEITRGKQGKKQKRVRSSIRRKCWSQEREKIDYELMFSITEKNLHSKIENVAQVLLLHA